jgi:hypothetical protein
LAVTCCFISTEATQQTRSFNILVLEKGEVRMTPETSTNDTPNPGGTTGESKSSSNDKRYRRRCHRKTATTTTRTVIRQPKFEGKCEDLKGHIYDCSDARQSDIFVKTTKEIAEYVGRTFKKGSDRQVGRREPHSPNATSPGCSDR